MFDFQGPGLKVKVTVAVFRKKYCFCSSAYIYWIKVKEVSLVGWSNDLFNSRGGRIRSIFQSVWHFICGTQFGTIPGDRSMRIASVYESKSSINCIKPFYPINIAKLPPRILGYGIVPEDTSFHLFQLLCCWCLYDSAFRQAYLSTNRFCDTPFWSTVSIHSIPLFI